MNHICATLRAMKPTKMRDSKDLLPALERCENEIRKHDEIIGAAMLNAATKKAIETWMAPLELATHT